MGGGGFINLILTWVCAHDLILRQELQGSIKEEDWSQKSKDLEDRHTKEHCLSLLLSKRRQFSEKTEAELTILEEQYIPQTLVLSGLLKT